VPEHEHADVQAPEVAATVAPGRAGGPRSTVEFALALQRSAGNAATARVLSRLSNPQARTAASGRDDTALTQQRHTGWAFVRGVGEHETGVNADDVVQGGLGDCYFLSPVQAVARINPEKIYRLIRGPVETQEDGTRIFEVDLYERRAVGSPRKHTLRITDRFVSTASGSSRYAQPGDLGVHGREIWVMLLEKAWAAMGGGYDEIHFGLMRDGMTAVTGYDTDTSFIANETDADIWTEISECVRDGKPVTIQTKQSFTGEELFEMADIEYNLVAQHAYNVAGVDATWRSIDIVNPHGSNHALQFPLVRLRRFFDYYVMSEESVR